MICWGLGGFGIGLTGPIETNTKEDMGAHAQLILLWGANLASQPNTARYLAAAKQRGAWIVTIDVRYTEAAAQSNEVFVIRPGTDAALALALMHVIIGEGLCHREFVETHTVGFGQLTAVFRGQPLVGGRNHCPELDARRDCHHVRRLSDARAQLRRIGHVELQRAGEHVLHVALAVHLHPADAALDDVLQNLLLLAGERFRRQAASAGVTCLRPRLPWLPRRRR